ncbi:MAG: helix-turn-helix transcriptional regulator [Dehalococcoidia bacterium]
MDVENSVGNFPASPSVDKPTPEELAALIAERLTPPRVLAYELAEALGCDPASVSRFENGRALLPHGMGPAAYRAALKRLKDRKRGVAA